MFIPKKSDGQISVNMRNKLKEKKIKKNSISLYPLLPRSFLRHSSLLFSFFFLMWDPYVPLFHFLVRFNPKTIYFVPVSISFIIIEYSLNIYLFSEFFKNPVFRFHSISIAYKFVRYSNCLGIQRNFSRSLDFVRRT